MYNELEIDAKKLFVCLKNIFLSEAVGKEIHGGHSGGKAITFLSTRSDFDNIYLFYKCVMLGRNLYEACYCIPAAAPKLTSFFHPLSLNLLF